MTSRSTNEPLPTAPSDRLCAWATPSDVVNSWFISTVNVPSSLSNAPRPSGTPTIRYAPTESPAEMIDCTVTAGVAAASKGEAHGGVGRDDVGSRGGDVPGLEGLKRKTDLPHGAAIGFRARHSKPTLPGHGAVLLVMTISVRQTRWNARSVRMTV